MSSKWDYAKELTNKHNNSSGGLFVRLANDGDKVVGVFVGEPYAREVHWSGERYVLCIDEGCSYCGEGKKPSMRAAMNFYVPAENKMKIIEGGNTWFKDVLKVRDKYDLTQWTFEVKRHGEARSPRTAYSILPEEKIDDATLAELSRLPLHDLERIVSGNVSEDNNDSYNSTNNDAPIDPQVANEFIPRLKALPREAVDVFCTKFGVSKIRDLKATDEPNARVFLENLEAKYGQSHLSTDTEKDPFK